MSALGGRRGLATPRRKGQLGRGSRKSREADRKHSYHSWPLPGIMETLLPGDYGNMATMTLKSKLVNLCICHKAKKS